MILIYKLLSKFIKFIINILFVVQITLMVLVFLTATYWFLTLINVTAFDFARPIADAISDLVKLFYHQEVMMGGIYIDGSLLLFDLIAVAIVFGITKSKYYIHKLVDFIELQINKCENRIEAKFNQKLQKEVEKNIKQSNNVALLAVLCKEYAC
ncbi:MAG: hypothetical protein ACLSA2_08045 [Candidatus Gastranaerophilaceae bacterium]